MVVVFGFVWVGVEYDVVGIDYGLIVVVVIGLVGLLMVSNFKYNFFKEVNWYGKVLFVGFFLVFLIFVVVVIEFVLVLFFVFVLYVLVGFINMFCIVEKVMLDDVVGDYEEDVDFNVDKKKSNESVDNK